MSHRSDKVLSLTGTDIKQLSLQELYGLFEEVLKDGIHGIGFSPYEEGQEPGDIVSALQIERRMEIIKPYTKWVRSFSCTDGNELIPQIAHKHGIKTMVGAWLGKDPEIAAMIIKTNIIGRSSKGFE